MKKIINFMAAALIASSCFSCSKKTDTEEKQPQPTEQAVDETVVGVTDEDTEPVTVGDVKEYREYCEDDFRKIRLSTTMSDKSLPYDIKCIKFSDIGLNERVPVYNRAEFAEQAYTEIEILKFDFNGDWESRINVPEKPAFYSACSYNGKVYIAVTYGLITGGYCECAVVCYDPESGESREFFTWSSENLDESCRSIQFYEDKMFYSCIKDGRSSVRYIDLNTYEEKTVHEEDASLNSVVIYDYDMQLLAFVIVTIESEMEDYRIFVYDKESGEFKEYANEEIEKMYSTRESDNTIVRFRSDNYSFRVSSDYSGDAIYHDDDRFIMRSPMHIDTYDLKKMEHYELALGSAGDPIFYYDGLVFLHSMVDNAVNCVVPGLGIVYRVLENVNYCFGNGYGDYENAGVIFENYAGGTRFYILNKSE